MRVVAPVELFWVFEVLFDKLLYGVEELELPPLQPSEARNNIINRHEAIIINFVFINLFLLEIKYEGFLAIRVN